MTDDHDDAVRRYLHRRVSVLVLGEPVIGVVTSTAVGWGDGSTSLIIKDDEHKLHGVRAHDDQITVLAK